MVIGPTTVIYAKVRWQSLDARREQRCLLFVYKALLCVLPDYLVNLINVRSYSHHLRSQDILTLESQCVRTKWGKKAFCNFAAVYHSLSLVKEYPSCE